MKLIPLTREQFAMVDDEDYEWISQFKWHAKKDRSRFYAVGWAPGGKHKRSMHVTIMGKKGIDHIDGNGLNNQRLNLRPATSAQQMANRRVNSNNSSGYKGIYFAKDRQRWRAAIGHGKRRTYLGDFKSPVEAAAAYDAAAIKFFGEFACPNFK